MPKQELGQLEEVPLREVFDDEPNDFTPWLADNLDLLGEILDLNLTLVEIEGEVGSLYVDIVADSEDGLVVIENQLERTNHSHLGQLLSYGAGRGARFLVWVAPEFKEEHRAALDWLNEGMPEDTEFYAVEVRVVRVGDSLPAPEFRAVASPNSWSRQVGSKRANGSTSPWTRETYRKFYQPVIDALREKELTEETRSSGSYYQRFSSEAAREAELEGVEYRISLTTPRDGHSANVYLYMGSADSEFNLKMFDFLDKKKEEIEQGLGEELIWRHARGYRPAVSLTHPVSLFDPPEKLGEVQEWMIEVLPKIKDVFEPRLLETADFLNTEEAEGVEAGATGDDIE